MAEFGFSEGNSRHFRVCGGAASGYPYPMNPLNKKAGFNLIFIVVAGLGIMAVQSWLARTQAEVTLPYSEFRRR
jgi:hypothetical protein